MAEYPTGDEDVFRNWPLICRKELSRGGTKLRSCIVEIQVVRCVSKLQEKQQLSVLKTQHRMHRRSGPIVERIVENQLRTTWESVDSQLRTIGDQGHEFPKRCEPFENQLGVCYMLTTR